MNFTEYILLVLFLLPYFLFLGTFIIALIYFPFYLFKLFKDSKNVDR